MQVLYKELKSFDQLEGYMNSSKINQVFSNVAISCAIHDQQLDEKMDIANKTTTNVQAFDFCKQQGVGKYFKGNRDRFNQFQVISSVKEHFPLYREVYDLLEEEVSKENFFALVMFLLCPYTSRFFAGKLEERINPDYQGECVGELRQKSGEISRRIKGFSVALGVNLVDFVEIPLWLKKIHPSAEFRLELASTGGQLYVPVFYVDMEKKSKDVVSETVNKTATTWKTHKEEKDVNETSEVKEKSKEKEADKQEKTEEAQEKVTAKEGNPETKQEEVVEKQENPDTKVEEKQEEVDEKQENPEAKQEEVVEKQENPETKQEEVDEKQEEVDEKQEEVDETQEEVDENQEESDEKQEEVDEKQEEVDETQEDYSAVLASLPKATKASAVTKKKSTEEERRVVARLDLESLQKSIELLSTMEELVVYLHKQYPTKDPVCVELLNSMLSGVQSIRGALKKHELEF